MTAQLTPDRVSSRRAKQADTVRAQARRRHLPGALSTRRRCAPAGSALLRPGLRRSGVPEDVAAHLAVGLPRRGHPRTRGLHRVLDRRQDRRRGAPVRPQHQGAQQRVPAPGHPVGRDPTTRGTFGGNQIVCPFHGWRFNTDGTQSYIYCRQGLRPRLDRLRTRRCSPRCARPSSTASCGSTSTTTPRLSRSSSATTTSIWRRWRWTGCGCAGGSTLSFRGNWKVATEAFLEAYHVMQAHPELALGATDDDYDVDGIPLLPPRHGPRGHRDAVRSRASGDLHAAADARSQGWSRAGSSSTRIRCSSRAPTDSPPHATSTSPTGSVTSPTIRCCGSSSRSSTSTPKRPTSRCLHWIPTLRPTDSCSRTWCFSG